jgi:hypothetical protein
MQDCALRLAHAGRDSDAICARALEGRTGELPADLGLGSSGRGTAAQRSRGRLARSLDASRQSVILLRKHFLLTILHYCYSNKPCTVSLKRKSPEAGLALWRRGKVPMFRLTRSATRALPETRGDLHPSFCQDRSAVPQVRRAGYGGSTADRSMGVPLETGHPCKGMMPPRCGRTPRQCSLERG